jgi:fumarylpyruvate hydrolase
MTYVVPAPQVVSVPIVGKPERFPVNRIYCVGRNYVEHAQEMGYTGREPPFFFMKPADAIVVADPDAGIPYPPRTSNFHYEAELVVAIGAGGRNIAASNAAKHIYGYAVGLDMTRRDLQIDMRKQGRPWDIGKGFDHSAPIGPITPIAQVPGIDMADITLRVNDAVKQSSNIQKLIWNIGEVIEHLSASWELKAGDLIYTGTPEGVGPVVRGDTMVVEVTSLPAIRVNVL